MPEQKSLAVMVAEEPTRKEVVPFALQYFEDAKKPLNEVESYSAGPTHPFYIRN